MEEINPTAHHIEYRQENATALIYQLGQWCQELLTVRKQLNIERKVLSTDSAQSSEECHWHIPLIQRQMQKKSTGINGKYKS